MRWRLPLLAGSLTGCLLFIFLSLLSSTLVGGLLRFLVLVHVSLFGLLVGLILLIGPPVLFLGLHRMLGMFIGRLAVVPPDIVDALRGAHDRSSVDDFWSVWSEGLRLVFFEPSVGRVVRLLLLLMPTSAVVGCAFGGKSAGSAGFSRLWNLISLTQFLAFVGSFLPQDAELDLPPNSGRGAYGGCPC